MQGSRPLTDQEIAQVLQQFTGEYATRNKALFITGVKTGFRISELLSLRVADVARDGKILPTVSVARKSMKGKRAGRSVPLHRDAQRTLASWLTELSERHPITRRTMLFSGANPDRAISRVAAWQALTRAYDRCGLTGKLGCHAMRKSFAQRVYHRLDRDLVNTQHALGHASIANTVKYLSFDRQAVERAILA
jgi:integrase